MSNEVIKTINEELGKIPGLLFVYAGYINEEGPWPF